MSSSPNLPQIAITLDPLEAFQLLAILNGLHEVPALELSLKLIGIESELVKLYPALKPLVRAGWMGAFSVNQAKLIIGLE